jgi:predicted metal-dependent phosphoesterase TrpH
MTQTTQAATRLVRLPMWLGLEEHIDEVIDQVGQALRKA